MHKTIFILNPRLLSESLIIVRLLGCFCWSSVLNAGLKLLNNRELHSLS